MFRRTHTPHVILVQELPNGHVCLIDEFRSVNVALAHVRQLLAATDTDVAQLRTYEYLGENVWRVSRVAVDERPMGKPTQLSLFTTL